MTLSDMADDSIIRVNASLACPVRFSPLPVKKSDSCDAMNGGFNFCCCEYYVLLNSNPMK